MPPLPNDHQPAADPKAIELTAEQLKALQPLIKQGVRAANGMFVWLIDKFVPQNEWEADDRKAAESALFSVAEYYNVAAFAHPLLMYAVVMGSIAAKNAKPPEQIEAEAAEAEAKAEDTEAAEAKAPKPSRRSRKHEPPSA